MIVSLTFLLDHELRLTSTQKLGREESEAVQRDWHIKEIFQGEQKGTKGIGKRGKVRFRAQPLTPRRGP